MKKLIKYTCVTLIIALALSTFAFAANGDDPYNRPASVDPIAVVK